jgi:osmotically-inducible protein OsmY
MVRALLRLVLVLIVVAAVAAFFIGYRYANRSQTSEPDYTTGTAGTVNVDKARDAGAAIGARVAEGANEAGQAVREAGITAKIKSKMALDDTIDATRINVDTSGEVVVLKGSVGSEAERKRAVQLARETDGVTSVVDQLTIR